MLALCCGLLAAPAASAQTDAEKAAELYKAGIDLYFAEDFGLAITKFQAGYQLDPNSMFLYSLSLCFSKLGNHAQALDHASRAKEAGGMPDDVTVKNDARIVSFAMLVRSADLAESIAASAQDLEPEPACAVDDDCGTGQVCDVPRGLCVPEPTDAPRGKPLFGPVGWIGVGAAVVGIGGLAWGGVTSLAVATNEERLTELSDPDHPDFDEEEADSLRTKLESQKSLGRILVLGGAGLTAVGVALVIVDLVALGRGEEEEEQALRVIPLIYPDGAGIGAALRF